MGVSDAEQFFTMLDEDGSGEVDLVEFVQGMQRLRGEAKSVDIHMMLYENRKMLRIVNGLVDYMGDKLAEVGSEPASPKSPKAHRSTLGSASPKVSQVSQAGISNSIVKRMNVELDAGPDEEEV